MMITSHSLSVWCCCCFGFFFTNNTGRILGTRHHQCFVVVWTWKIYNFFSLSLFKMKNVVSLSFFLSVYERDLLFAGVLYTYNFFLFIYSIWFTEFSFMYERTNIFFSCRSVKGNESNKLTYVHGLYAFMHALAHAYFQEGMKIASSIIFHVCKLLIIFITASILY